MGNDDDGNKFIAEHWEEIDLSIQIVRQRILQNIKFKRLEFLTADMLIMSELFGIYPLHTKKYLSCDDTQEIVFFLERTDVLSTDMIQDLAYIMTTFQNTVGKGWRARMISKWRRSESVDSLTVAYAFVYEGVVVVAAIPISSIIKQEIRMVA
jgi:hypothetical protein